MSAPLLIGLSAVIVAAEARAPVFLAIRRDGGEPALPYGAFDPVGDRTFELALRGWVSAQTGFDLGYVEQLYTFGDQGRDTPSASKTVADKDARLVSVGYLALTPEQADVASGFDAQWRDWYAHFPWEDHRDGRPNVLSKLIEPQLLTWSAGSSERTSRAKSLFGMDEETWADERVLERYELLYEAGLVAECARDAGLPTDADDVGEPMASDHRRILATAMGRLRGKLRYRPIIFELMPDLFTLSALQQTTESILGRQLHKQNFRRSLERTGLVEGTGKTESATGGRPAELFRVKGNTDPSRSGRGLATPAVKTD